MNKSQCQELGAAFANTASHIRRTQRRMMKYDWNTRYTSRLTEMVHELESLSRQAFFDADQIRDRRVSQGKDGGT